jgi:dephospho-CoA kinase
MKVVALTGGIASGKSLALQILQDLDGGVRVFDCDAWVQKLLATPRIAAEISSNLKGDLVDSQGALERHKLRSLVFDDPDQRTKLEAILHPEVRKECLVKRDEYRHDPSATLFVVDVPLLYESAFSFGQELNLVVATSCATQRVRLKARSHFEDRMIESILQSQLPILDKVAKGDVAFWNEGPPSVLRCQLQRFLHSL